MGVVDDGVVVVFIAVVGGEGEMVCFVVTILDVVLVVGGDKGSASGLPLPSGVDSSFPAGFAVVVVFNVVLAGSGTEVVVSLSAGEVAGKVRTTLSVVAIVVDALGTAGVEGGEGS